MRLCELLLDGHIGHFFFLSEEKKENKICYSIQEIYRVISVHAKYLRVICEIHREIQSWPSLKGRLIQHISNSRICKLRGDVYAVREIKRNVLGPSGGKGYLPVFGRNRKIFMQKVAFELYLEKMDKISVSEMGEETEVLGSCWGSGAKYRS